MQPVTIFSPLLAIPSSSLFCLLSELRQGGECSLRSPVFNLHAPVFNLQSSLVSSQAGHSKFKFFSSFFSGRRGRTSETIMPITLHDLRTGSPDLERILMEFLQFHSRKRQLLQLHSKKRKRSEKPWENNKRLVLRVILPKKPTDSALNNSENIKQKQEKEELVKSKKHKRQRKNPVDTKQEVPFQPAFMPTEFIFKITDLKGFEINLVIQKKLTETDMKSSQDRLSIPRSQMRYDFLTLEEQICLEEKDTDGIHFKGLQLPLIEPNLLMSTIFLKKWKLGSSSTYMLSTPWINMANRNGLKAGNTIQLWSFRVNLRPHLALINLDK